MMGCRSCEEMRRAAANALLRVFQRQRCIVHGCTSRPEPTICLRHWRQLPLDLRRRWWDESNYGRRPTQQLIDDVNAAIRSRAD
jgi:hypothetical protein